MIFDLSVTSLAGDKPLKLPTVKPPTKFTNEIVVTSKEVYYSVVGEGVLSDFVADHKGQLKRVRILTGDNKAFYWDCHYIKGHLDTGDHVENGVHQGGTILIDKARWVKFYENQLMLKAFQFKEEPNSRLTVCTVPVEYVGYDETDDWLFLKVEGVTSLMRFKESQFMVSFPRKGKFYLGICDSRYLPLGLEGDKWHVLMPDNVYAHSDLPQSK